MPRKTKPKGSKQQRKRAIPKLSGGGGGGYLKKKQTALKPRILYYVPIDRAATGGGKNGL